MKCVRCAAEIPGQSRFCMRCGTPVGSPSAASMAFRSPVAPTPRRGIGKAAIIAAAALLCALVGFAGFKLLNPTNRSAVAPNGSPLVDTSARIHDAGPLTDRNAIGPPPQPVDVVDYVKFLREVEARRVRLAKQELAQVLEMSQTLTGSNILSQMKDSEEDISKSENDTYKGVQTRIAGWQADWNSLSQFFLSKQAPQSCTKLRDKYYDMLGKTESSIIGVANSFSEAMAGDPSKALQQLSNMKGSASQTIDTAAADADNALADVCDKYHIHKDFDIRADGGGSSLFGSGFGLGGIQ